MALRHELEILGRDQCLDLLRTVRVGRLVFTEQARPAVQPVNFRGHCQLEQSEGDFRRFASAIHQVACDL